MNPMVSRESVVLSAPVRGIIPKEGFIPHTPQKLEGRIMEPAVCVANANGTIPVATETADPLDDVPGVFYASWGLSVSFSA